MRWCTRADVLLDVAGMHVHGVVRETGRLVLVVETDADVAGCPACGVVAVGHGRRDHRVHDAPCFTLPSVVVWRKRVWRCAEPACATQTFSETQPLVEPRGLLRHGAENLTATARSPASTPAWPPGTRLRGHRRLAVLPAAASIYHASSPAHGRRSAEQLIASFTTCPIGEVARLGHTLRSWRAQVLAYFDTGGVSNGGTEAINVLIEKTRRLAHGFRNFHHYRLRVLLAADGTRSYRRRPTHA